MFTAIAHRGDNRRYTENTRAAFDSSLEHGFTALELDLVRIKDGTVVLFHDDTLERLCGVSLNARDLTYHQFKAAFPELLTLYEFMALYGRNDLSLNFEIKGDRYTFAGVEPYLSFCTDPLISSFDLDLMRDVRAAGLPAGFLVHTGPELLSVLRDFPGARIHASHELVPLLYGLQSALAAGNHTV
ncbi:MAG: hypothetical protein KDK27_19385, partial [Leptospiraceae bacterium]|nr:hypothetical protein [Leptospiraceae bacterium]